MNGAMPTGGRKYEPTEISTRSQMEEQLRGLTQKVHFTASDGQKVQAGNIALNLSTSDIPGSDNCRLEIQIVAKNVAPEILEHWRFGVTTQNKGAADYHVAISDCMGRAQFRDLIPRGAKCWLELNTSSLEEIIGAIKDTTTGQSPYPVDFKMPPKK